MITLEEVEHRLSEANEALKLYKEQEAKKQSEPCPLEEGKFAYVQLTPEAVKKWFEDMENEFRGYLFARIGVESDSEVLDGVGGMAIHIGFTEYAALEHARSLVKACGVKSD